MTDPRPSVGESLANVHALLRTQQDFNAVATRGIVAARTDVARAHTRLDGHDTDIEGLAQCIGGLTTSHETTTARITALSDNHDGTVARVIVLEDNQSERIDWLGAGVITGIVGVIAAIAWYMIVIGAGWDPFLAVQDGVAGDVKDKAYSILLYHVFAFTLVTMAITFAVCVCTLTKSVARQQSQQQMAPPATAEEEEPGDVVPADPPPATPAPVTPVQPATAVLPPPPGPRGQSLSDIHAGMR